MTVLQASIVNNDYSASFRMHVGQQSLRQISHWSSIAGTVSQTAQPHMSLKTQPKSLRQSSNQNCYFITLFASTVIALRAFSSPKNTFSNVFIQRYSQRKRLGRERSMKARSLWLICVIT